jgi:Tol biopolymer transport system component
MKTLFLPAVLSLLTILNTSVSDKSNGTCVGFPDISDPLSITDTNKEHLFASYYGINSFDKSERYATVLETDIKYKLPDENEPATLGLVDLRTKSFRPLTITRAWNFQQGCMAHWLGTSPDSLIIYNDLRNSRFVSVILNVFTGQELKVYPFPVSAVSQDGKEAISINFARLRMTRPDYGYGGNGQDTRSAVQFPEDDGLFLVNLETGQAKLLVSYARIKDLVPVSRENNIEWINHTLFSRNGSKIFWLSRHLEDKAFITTAFTVNKDGTDLQRCFPDGWGGSHFDWLNDDELMITASWQGKIFGHILFTPGKQGYRRLGNGILDYDGHGTFSPDGRWMVTDTYPDQGSREQKIYLMDMATQAVLPLGRFIEPAEFKGHWRCDIHCRWSPKGDLIGFNSTKTGSRQVYIFRLKMK